MEINVKNTVLTLLLLILFIIVVYYFVNEKGQEAAEETSATDTDQIELQDAFTAQGTEISFTHTVPGEYSEVFYLVRGGTPGQTKLVTLEGPSVVDSNDQIATFDENGEARYVWKINRYGTYSTYEDIYDEVSEQDIPQLLDSVTVN